MPILLSQFTSKLAPIHARVSPRLLVSALALIGIGMTGCGADPVKTFGGGGTGGQQSGATGGVGARGDDGGSGDASGAGGQSGGGGGGTGGSGGGGGSGGASASGGGGGPAGGASSGGRSGNGGVIGSGGQVSGTGGTGGTGGIAASSCDQLAADYQKELRNAKACTIGLGLSQCQTQVARSLGCGSNCITYVQDATALSELQRRWTAGNCEAVKGVCPAIACTAAQRGNCAISGSIAAPQCQDSAVLSD